MKKICLLVFLSCLFACSQATPPRAPNASRTPVASHRIFAPGAVIDTTQMREPSEAAKGPTTHVEAAGLAVPVKSIKGDADAGAHGVYTLVGTPPQTVTQAHWSIELPANWTVKDASAAGMEATRDAPPATAIMILSQALPTGMMPQTWVLAASLKVQDAAPKTLKVLSTNRAMITFKGHVGSVTAITFANGFLIGAVAVVDEKQNVGYIIAATGAAQEGEMLANITKTFDIK
jgi:hypothetical protein